jgi:hypothetical protein
MSRSPRKALRHAAHALDLFVAVLEDHPEAREAVVERVGEEGVSEIAAIRQRVQWLAE